MPHVSTRAAKRGHAPALDRILQRLFVLASVVLVSAKKEGQVRIGFRMPGSIMQRAEQQAARLSDETGLEVTAQDVIRAVLGKHLDPLEPGERSPRAKKEAKKA